MFSVTVMLSGTRGKSQMVDLVSLQFRPWALAGLLQVAGPDDCPRGQEAP